MSISQRQIQNQLQTLSPQQIQMIKLLELPTLQLEQRVKQEIEENIVLEEDVQPQEEDEGTISVDEYIREDDSPSYKSRINNYSHDEKQRPLNLSEGRSLQEYLVEQIGYRTLSPRDKAVAEFMRVQVTDPVPLCKREIKWVL